MFAVDSPWHVLVSGHLGVVDLQVGRTRLEDLLFGVELGVRVTNEAFNFYYITRLAAFRWAQDFNLERRFLMSGRKKEEMIISDVTL